MKFYRHNTYYYSHYYFDKIIINKLDCVYLHVKDIYFYKNGKLHNNKNASYQSFNKNFRTYYLNGIIYGNQKDFNKQSCRKFVRKLKLQAFL